MHLKVSSANWHPFRSNFNIITPFNRFCFSSAFLVTGFVHLQDEHGCSLWPPFLTFRQICLATTTSCSLQADYVCIITEEAVGRSWWRHQMETFSASLAICAGNSPGEFPTQRPVTRSFDIFFGLCLNERLSKQCWGWWLETLSHHYDVIVMLQVDNVIAAR